MPRNYMIILFNADLPIREISVNYKFLQTGQCMYYTVATFNINFDSKDTRGVESKVLWNMELLWLDLNDTDLIQGRTTPLLKDFKP